MIMEWYHAAGLFMGATSLALVIVINCRNYKRDRRDRDIHKLAIKDTIYDAEIVMRNVSALSRDYDFMDGREAACRIAAYARKNTPKVERAIDEIRRHYLYLDSSDPLKGRIKDVLSTLDWFVDTYGGDGAEPSVKQRVVWNEGRGTINDKIDQILTVAENM